ncbi:MAG TPA: VOC family protein [Nakamurella sp.]|jgi:catechol 2,3-dioxygenase-like lactoylglutathione lyase family enzyme|nr:VOC family protein [Nakamurella sp.]
MIGRLHGIVIDCPDPDSLARFYEQLLGMIRVQESEQIIVIGDSADRPGLAFARVPDYRPPTWPTGERPQYLHLDARVDDLAQATERAEALGARRLPGGGDNFTVFADPIGHPFCLVQF